jgi:sorbitol-specific phosphotransferase system component IIBC
MEKDIGKIAKNPDTDIVVRIDDFGGRVGLTIREFVKSERYTGFTKAGTRIPLDKISEFKNIISSINEAELQAMASEASAVASAASPAKEQKAEKKESAKKDAKAKKSEAENFEDAAF